MKAEDAEPQDRPLDREQTVQLHTKPRDDSWSDASSTFVDLSLDHVRSEFDGTRPSRVGPFHVGELLGEGGMGVVYEARDPRLDRKVALKLVRSTKSHEKGARSRIMKEARGLASVSHPHVVQVYESDVHEEQVYVAMEFLSGGTLKEWLAAETRPWPEVVRVFLQAGEGLVAAHARGLVHRDFKPDNVIFHADGRAKVTDFGLVGKADALAERKPTQQDMGTFEQIELLMSSEGFDMTAPITRTGALMGTPAFMAPEQFLARKIGAEADQWAFCVALYWALFGRHPFESPSVAALATTLADPLLSMPTPSHEARRQVPKGVLAAIQRGLSPAPGDRHDSMGDLLSALERVLPVAADAGPRGGARSSNAMSLPMIRWLGGRPRRGVGAVVLGLSLVVGGWGWSNGRAEGSPSVSEVVSPQLGPSEGLAKYSVAKVRAPSSKDPAEKVATYLYDDSLYFYESGHYLEAQEMMEDAVEAAMEIKNAKLRRKVIESLDYNITRTYRRMSKQPGGAKYWDIARERTRRATSGIEKKSSTRSGAEKNPRSNAAGAKMSSEDTLQQSLYAVGVQRMELYQQQGIGGDLRDLELARRILSDHVKAGDRGLKVEWDAEDVLDKVLFLIENHKKDKVGEDALE